MVSTLRRRPPWLLSNHKTRLWKHRRLRFMTLKGSRSSSARSCHSDVRTQSGDVLQSGLWTKCDRYNKKDWRESVKDLTICAGGLKINREGQRSEAWWSPGMHLTSQDKTRPQASSLDLTAQVWNVKVKIRFFGQYQSVLLTLGSCWVCSFI